MGQDRDDIGIGMDSGLRLRLHTGCLFHDANMSRFLGQEEQIVGPEEQNVGQEEQNVVQGEKNVGRFRFSCINICCYSFTL